MKVKHITYLIGLGLVLFVIHNKYQPLLSYLFLPWIGLMFLVVGSISILQRTKVKDLKGLLGEKKVWIPLAIIAGSIVASKMSSWNDFLSSLSLASMFFLLYMAVNSKLVDKEKLWKPFAIAAVIESLSIIVWAATHGWMPNGGLVSPTNYDIATGVVILGILVAPKKHLWWLSSIGIVGLLFSGSGEALFVSTALLITALAYRVTWWKVAIPLGATLITLAIIIPTGIFERVQAPNVERLSFISQAYVQLPPSNEFWVDAGRLASQIVTEQEYNQKPVTEAAMASATTLDKITGYRMTHFQLTMPIKPFGYGINLTNFYWGIPHNVVLIIIEQVGVLALLAWLWIAYLGLRKKDTRVLWIGFLALGVFDHFIWTQAAPWFWVLAAGINGTIGVRNENIRVLRD